MARLIPSVEEDAISQMKKAIARYDWGKIKIKQKQKKLKL